MDHFDGCIRTEVYIPMSSLTLPFDTSARTRVPSHVHQYFIIHVPSRTDNKTFDLKSVGLYPQIYLRYDLTKLRKPTLPATLQKPARHRTSIRHTRAAPLPPALQHAHTQPTHNQPTATISRRSSIASIFHFLVGFVRVGLVRSVKSSCSDSLRGHTRNERRGRRTRVHVDKGIDRIKIEAYRIAMHTLEPI